MAKMRGFKKQELMCAVSVHVGGYCLNYTVGTTNYSILFKTHNVLKHFFF